jgi:hypothetical protein
VRETPTRCTLPAVPATRLPETTNPDRLLAAYYEEYRALYALVEFRMAALDRRAPVTAAAFAGAVASMQAVPVEARFVLFVALPIALVWLTRTTINHARSFEDVLRRIEEIEHAVNSVLKADVLRFQSNHPSRHRRVGGRTGHESVLAVLGTADLVLAALAFQATEGFKIFTLWTSLYLCFLASIVFVTTRYVFRLNAYTYKPSNDLAMHAAK